MTEQGEKLFFCSFASRNTSYDCILALWKNISNHAKGFDENKAEDSESDEDIKHDLMKEQTKHLPDPAIEVCLDLDILPWEKSKSLSKSKSLILQTNDVKELLDEKEVIVSDEELKKLAEGEAKEENEEILHEEIFPITVDQYWKNFLANDAPFTLKEFIEEHKKDFEMNLEEWKESPAVENPELPKIDTSELDKWTLMSRYCHGSVRVTGAPFCSWTRYFKT